MYHDLHTTVSHLSYLYGIMILKNTDASWSQFEVAGRWFKKHDFSICITVRSLTHDLELKDPDLS